MKKNKLILYSSWTINYDWLNIKVLLEVYDFTLTFFDFLHQRNMWVTLFVSIRSYYS